MTSNPKSAVPHIFLILLCLTLPVAVAHFAIHRPKIVFAFDNSVSPPSYIQSEDNLYALARRSDPDAIRAMRVHAWQMLYTLLYSVDLSANKNTITRFDAM